MVESGLWGTTRAAPSGQGSSWETERGLCLCSRCSKTLVLERLGVRNLNHVRFCVCVVGLAACSCSHSEVVEGAVPGGRERECL